MVYDVIFKIYPQFNQLPFLPLLPQSQPNFLTQTDVTNCSAFILLFLQYTQWAPYLGFHFPWFQLLEVSWRQETDDHSDVKSPNLCQNDSILTSPPAIMWVFYHFTSSKEG